MPLPTQPVYFLPLSETALAAFLDVGQIPASALERAGEGGVAAGEHLDDAA